MAKPKKLLPARSAAKPRVEESLALRTAESVGRVIGALHRQLDGAMQRINGRSNGAVRAPRRATDDVVTSPGRRAPNRRHAGASATAPPRRTAAKKTGATRPRVAATKAARPK